MSKVITVSRQFPAHHLKKGQPTFFVEKICNSLLMAGGSIYTDNTPVDFLQSLSKDFFNAKHHTIRAGKRWKTGDKASIRVCSDKPYRSPQIAIAPDVEIVVKDIEWNVDGMIIDGVHFPYSRFEEIAKNDGLSELEMIDWFRDSLPFSGQILIWNNNNLPY